jgi:site-specific DNA-cytosine methylase
VFKRYRAPKKLDPINPELRGQPAKFLKTVRQGETLRSARERYVAGGSAKREREVKKTGFALGRLDPAKPSRAVVGAMLIHPYEDRWCNIQELAHLSGFPRTYQFSGRPDAMAGEISRGVLPPVGAWLAGLVATGVRNDVRFDRDPKAWEVNLFKPPGVIKEITDEVRA